jgi:hypothetical protein
MTRARRMQSTRLTLSREWYKRSSGENHGPFFFENGEPQNSVLSEADLVLRPPPTHTKRARDAVASATVSQKRRMDPQSSIADALTLLLAQPQRSPFVERLTYRHPLMTMIRDKLCEDKGKKQQRVSDIPRPTLDVVPKAYADSYMRPPGVDADESPCEHGTDCECVKMASVFGVGSPQSQGFVGVQFTTPTGETHKQCLLCLRRSVALRYCNILSSRRTCASGVLHPHRVRCGPGEYAPSACIQPRDGYFDGIVGAFVKHERHHYRYAGPIDNPSHIIQTSAVNFRQAHPSAEPG